MFRFAGAVSVERATEFAEHAQALTRETAGLVDGRVPSPDELNATLIRLLEATSTVGAITVTFPDGTYYDVHVDANSDGFAGQTRTIGADAAATWQAIAFDSDLRPTLVAYAGPTVDPLKEPAYLTGAEATQATWTVPILDPSTQVTQEWLVQPVRDAAGGLVAVVGVEVRLDLLSTVLNDLPGSSAEAFVLADNRAIVAAPASAADGIASIQTASHVVATDRSFGLHPDNLATPETTANVIGKDGNLVTLETALPADVAPWVVHVQATLGGLSPAAAELRRTLITMAVLMGVALVAGVTILLRTLRPLSRLRANAELDRLTGLNNRHYFDRRAKQVVARAVADGKVVAVAMVDLDNFKPLNDLRGHEEGDQALAMVGQVLRAEVRDTDMAIRWGGDEFLLVFAFGAGADPTAAVERVRAHVSVALDIKFGSAVRVGATAGFTLLGDAREPLAAAVSRADAALVAGKRIRKGRTYDVGASEAPAPPVEQPASAVLGGA